MLILTLAYFSPPPHSSSLRAYLKLPKNAFTQTRSTRQRLSTTSLIRRKLKRTLERCNVLVGQRLLLTMSSVDRDISSSSHQRTASLCLPCPIFAHLNHLPTQELSAGVRVRICLTLYESTVFNSLLIALPKMSCHSSSSRRTFW